MRCHPSFLPGLGTLTYKCLSSLSIRLTGAVVRNYHITEHTSTHLITHMTALPKPHQSMRHPPPNYPGHMSVHTIPTHVLTWQNAAPTTQPSHHTSNSVNISWAPIQCLAVPPLTPPAHDWLWPVLQLTPLTQTLYTTRIHIRWQTAQPEAQSGLKGEAIGKKGLLK